MPTGGHFSLSLSPTDNVALGPVVEVKIGDSGAGIPEELRKRVFDPYFTTKANGTGLGLAICKRIMTVHHGAITVESFPDAGTIFTVTLPISSKR
jgi:signal transduction histidine kinase